MTKEELEKEATEYAQKLGAKDFIAKPKEIVAYFGYLASAEPREKRIAELEEKISVLLSCKNCPENKGGFICVKEYENKCLAQKIQFIKELEKENAELKGLKDVATLIRAINDTVITLMQLNNMLVSKNQQLTKAKEIIKYLLSFIQKENYKTRWDINIAEAEQFISEVEK